jgi:pyruvate/2-oxoglutarate dehydrogenase complex dihydrolipoamide acyltransferase (E2) component
MAVVTATKGTFSVKAYIGDNKTLLAFNFTSAAAAKNLAGFTIQCQPPAGAASYYLFNDLQFPTPATHAQVATEPANSSVNAPFQKFRWTHVTGATHQGLTPATGDYIYTVTPRYFDANASMQPLDASLSATLTVPVGPFQKGSLTLGFTRGYMQSQAFTHHFGLKALLKPTAKTLLFDTSAQAGTDNQNQPYTFADEYGWMGASARERVFTLLNKVLCTPTLTVDIFAYDFNEPDVLSIVLQLAAQGRCRIILDNATLHHNSSGTLPEDQFTTLFQQKAKAPAAILRGHFARFSHDKIFIISTNGTPTQVLTGSTNFSITGLYVNANHVLVFDDPTVAAHYSAVFNESWNDKTSATAFQATALSTTPFTYQSATVPNLSITFSPHTTADAATILQAIADRATAEASAPNGSVLFAVMQLTGSDTPVYNTLSALHANQSLFSYGISDAPAGTFLYTPGTKTGVLVTGKPSAVKLPPPFDQVPSVPGHEIHDKFLVCGLNGSDPVVYCGSSNLASGGENQNGDNLLAVHDPDVATAFAIEALLLVDHYAFLNRYATGSKSTPSTAAPTAKKSATAKPRTSAAHRVAPSTAALAAPKKKKAVATKAVKKTPAKKTTPRKTTATKKVVPKKTSPKKTPPKSPAPAKTTPAASPQPLMSQPQSKQQAALTAGVYLYTNDTWATRYFDLNDLHGLERELFG